MKKKDKLKLVFDFIADYLIEDKMEISKNEAETSFKKKTGITLDNEGKLVKVLVEPMESEVGNIEKIINGINQEIEEKHKK